MTKKEVLACLYELVKDAPDINVTLRLVAIACECSEKDIHPVFKILVEEGLLKKRYMFLGVYKITEEGMRQARAATD